MTLAEAQEWLEESTTYLSRVLQLAITELFGAKLIGAGLAQPPLELQLRQLKRLVVERVVHPEGQRPLVEGGERALCAVDQRLAVLSVGPEAGWIPISAAALNLAYAAECLAAAMFWTGGMVELDAFKKEGEARENK